MTYRQFRFRLPWQSIKASSRLENESSTRSSEPTDEAETSNSAADTVPYMQHPPELSPLESAQAPERSETMLPSKSHKKAKVHSQPSSHSRAKKQTRTATKPPSASKVTPQSSVSSNKSPTTSAKASPSHDASKPSSSAGKVSPSHDTSKLSSPAGKGKVSPSHDTSKPSSPAGKAFPSRDASQPSSSAAAAPRSQIRSKPPSPSQTSSKNHPQSKPTSQSRLKADSPQPSSPSWPAFSPQASSIPRSPSHENSRQQPSKKASRVQSPSHLSSKPTAQSTSQQLTESPATIEDQTTKRVVSHPADQSPGARCKIKENQVQTKSKQSPKPDLKPVEFKASKHQPETMEEFISKNTSYPHSDQDFSEIPIIIDETNENGPEPSLESQTESQESKEIKSYEEDLEKTTNALQINASKSKLITSAEITSPFEPENSDSQQEGTMEDLSKAFQTLNIKYPEENPKSFTTLTGDNKGASMHLLSGEATKESAIHIHRQYKSDPDKVPESSTDIEGNSNEETPQDSKTEEDPPLELYININVQGINNSLLSNSSFTENNPGIKLKFVPQQTKSEDKPHSLHAQKAKYTAKHTENHTYEPTVRRRCLAGLLMESSDSDGDNSEKPRRHGCRYRGSFEGK
ncbi:hypothetical protein SDJN03_18320, partial [Cucurbita argyrosperma subsp. sororia]